MMSEDDEYADEELEAIRRRRYSDLQRSGYEEQRQAEARRPGTCTAGVTTAR